MIDGLQWVLNVNADQLPPAPFPIRQGITIQDPLKWLDWIKQDVLLGDKSPRKHTGALLEDVLRIYELTEGKYKW